MNSPLYVLSYLALWIVLMRALLVRAAILPPTCARCGLRFERRHLGETSAPAATPAAQPTGSRRSAAYGIPVAGSV